MTTAAKQRRIKSRYTCLVVALNLMSMLHHVQGLGEKTEAVVLEYYAKAAGGAVTMQMRAPVQLDRSSLDQ